METTLCVFVKLDTRDLAEKPVKRDSETGDGYDFRVEQFVIQADVTKLRSLLSWAETAQQDREAKLYIASRYKSTHIYALICTRSYIRRPQIYIHAWYFRSSDIRERIPRRR